MFQIFFIGFTTGCLVGFVVEWMLKQKLTSSCTNLTGPVEDEVPQVVSSNENTYKLVLVVNSELKMGDGKIMAQCAHAAVGSYETFYKTHTSNFEAWEHQGKQMSVYKVSDTMTLKALSKLADDMNLLTCLIRDAGHTQIAPGSTTVLAVGPVEESVLSPLVEHLMPF